MTYRAKRRLLVILALTPITIGAVTAIAIIWDGLNDQIQPVDVAIVPGNLVDRDGPSPRLKSRLDKTIELYERNLFGTVIVSGGIDRQGNNEAKIMKDYLVAHNIPEERIVVDCSGATTLLTAEKTSRIMREKDLHSAMVISQFFHISRTKLALRHFNVQCVGTAHANYYEMRDVYSTVREVVGYFAYLFK